MVKMASAPHSFGSLARHLGPPPPPHSSEKSSLVPSLLNVAECQYEKFESSTAATRNGCAGSWMSSSRPYPSQAPPAYPTWAYTVMSWHWVGPGGGPEPSFCCRRPTIRFTRSWMPDRSAVLSAAETVVPP